jgi:Alr-MurF fusion protein
VSNLLTLAEEPMIDFQQIAQITGGEILQMTENMPIGHLLTDTRKLLVSQYAIFIALSGPRHNGHAYIEEAYRQGVRQFLVSTPLSLEKLPGANILLVPNTLSALQAIAAWQRSQFNLQVIGITGSNGKTIVKEWLHTLLNKHFAITKNPKSYNSQVGVALSVWQLKATDTLGIFEAGISQIGEMEKLEQIIQPTIGLFTNIGTAHSGGFDSLQEKIREKAKLFKNSECIVYCGDHTSIKEELHRLHPDKKNFTWGKSEGNHLVVKEVLKSHSSARIKLALKGQSLAFQVPFSDEASLENILHVISIGLFLGLQEEEIQSRLLLVRPLAMRLELKQALHHSYLIDDTYSNDLAGLRVAIEFLLQQDQREKITLILSDFPQSGLPPERLKHEILQLITHNRIKRLIGVGPQLAAMGDFPVPESLFFPTTESLLSSLPKITFEKELILVKGARVFEFERIVRQLEKKAHGTALEINLNALTHNLNYFRGKVGPEVKIMAMVKAFAYGSGSFEVANLLQFHRVDYLGVAYTDEGVSLRENGIHLPIMVMNPSSDGFDKMLRYHLEPEIYSLSILRDYLEALGEETGHIHLKIDTGMHRLGFDSTQISPLIELLQQTKSKILVKSIFSHLAGADDTQHNEFSSRQATAFLQMSQKIADALGYVPMRHLVNSAGIMRFPEYHFEMVRLGIGLYGVEASGMEKGALQPVGTLKTVVSQVRHVPAGETIGYGRMGKAPKESIIATIAIGYGDGYSRAFSRGVGEVLINGHLAPVIGNVCMDMTMVDATNIPVQEGDEVIVFGEGLPIDQLAEKIHTIPYEILAGISERVKRVYYFD